MKFIPFTFIVFTLLESNVVFSQEDAYVPADIDKRKLSITSAGTSLSTIWFIDRHSTLDYYRSRHGRKSSMLKNDFTFYSTGQLYLNLSNKFSLQLNAFPFRKADSRESFQREIRPELSYASGETRSLSLFNTTRKPGDSLNYYGITLFSDTVVSRIYNFSEKTDEISISSCFVFYTPSHKRIHFSGGAGIEIGGSFVYSGLQGTYQENTYVSYQDIVGNHKHDKDLGFTNQTETFKIKPYYHAGVFFPITMEFRLSKKNELMKHFYLFLQGTYGLDYIIGNGTQNARTFYSMGSGIRYRIFSL